jgi:hypothetical protein
MQCKYIKSNKSQCKAKTIKESKYCFVHDPNNQEKRLEASAKGGSLSKKLNLDLDSINLKNSSDAVLLLEETINLVRQGDLPVNIANSIGYLSGHLLKAIEASEIQERLEVIERVIFERKQVKRK